MADPFPIDDALPALRDALRMHGRAVLQAPPGAGKTTRVPLALLDLVPGRILMLEPRRLAARAASERMAATLGEAVGQTVGYRIRGEAKVSRNTRIEVVTEGILTRMIQSDPELTGIGALIFDEFHERSLNADLGLALALEIRAAFRDDLKLLVMSATLDGQEVARLMGDAPVVTSEGRSFPVDVHWLDRPLPKGARLEPAAAGLILDVLADTQGGTLVFLPGEGEIRRTAQALAGRLPGDVALHTLFGAMDFKAQRAAIAPAQAGRNLVLATAIAETSLTIEDVTSVVDAGRARRARFDAGSGMTRLVTERVTRAEAEQRRGRAGRVAPGRCYRLWTRGEDGALSAYPPAEIEAADLCGLALELALWGVADPADLPFLTPPPEAALAEARDLLTRLGALDDSHRLTAHGTALAALPLHPRLGHMLQLGGQQAAPLAALLNDRDILRGAPADLTLRLDALADPKRFRATRPFELNQPARQRVANEVRRLTRRAGPAPQEPFSPAQLAALAYPDRIGLRRKGDQPRFLLSGGKGAVMADDDPLAGTRLIVVTDTDGAPRDARIRQAIAITEAELRAVHGDRTAWQSLCEWSRRSARVNARRQECLGAIVLDERLWHDAPPEDLARAMLDGLRELGLVWTDAARRFRARVELARSAGHALPAMDDATLLATLDAWLTPHLGDVQSADAWRRFDILPGLRTILDWQQGQTLDRVAPAQFETPLGRRIAIDYDGGCPAVALRLQELFGVTRHPQVVGRPLQITLLSPANRTVQVTTDLPGFWAGSYADVRKDMRARYPKHAWPEDPAQASPTTRAKPR